MKQLGWMVFAAAVWAVSSCSTVPSTCNAASCATGCCTAEGQCVSGASNTACGTAGAACVDCSVQHAGCVANACVFHADGGGTGTGGGSGGGTGTGGGTGQDAGMDAGVDAGTDAGSGRTTWPDGGSLTRYWDGGSCTVKTDCPCFSSEDCGPGFTCTSEDDTGLNVWCKPGMRGAGLVGAACTGEADCLSALCVEASDGGKQCSGLCDTVADCPATLPKCTYVGFGIDRSLCSP